MSEIVRAGRSPSRGVVRSSAMLWRTKEGEIITIEDMDSKHLFNSMKMIFNHLAMMWGGRPVWFTKQYSDYVQGAVTGPEELARQVMVLMRELDRRTDLPEIYHEPLAEIKAQIAARTQALPQPAEVIS